MKKLTSLLLTLAMIVSVCQFNIITASADGDIPSAVFNDETSITISNLPEDLENASLADDVIYDSEDNYFMASLDSNTEISLPNGDVTSDTEYHFTITSNNYEDIVIYAVYGTVANPTANTAPTKKAPATALPEAVNGKITLTKNVNLTAMAVIRETTTIDLAGYTITGTSNGMAIGVASGTLTLMDSSSAKTGKIVVSGEQSTAVLVYGTFIMNSGKLEASGQDSSGIYIENGGSATMKNGSITATGMGAIGAAAVGSNASATFTIENGNITAEGQGAIGIYLAGAEQNAVVSGGTITVNGDGSGYGIEAIEQGSTGHNITVSGGTINASGTRTYAIYLEMDNTLKISKGTLTSADSAAVVFFQGGNTAEITGGTITGRTYGVNIANSANNTLSVSGEAVLSGETGSINAGGNRYAATPAVTISGGYFNGAVSGGVPSAADDTYAIYDITGGYFTSEISDSALYNYALAKDYTTETYTDEIKANETNELASVSKTKDGVTYTYQVTEKEAPAPETVTITFNAGEGSFGKDDEQQDIKTKIVTIEKGASLTEEQLPSATPLTGYTFNGWGEITGKAVNESTSYTAEYTIQSFTITWDIDGVQTTEELAYGATPSYNGTPVKANDSRYTYEFIGWTPEIVPVSGIATYKAEFKQYVKSVNNAAIIEKETDTDGTKLIVTPNDSAMTVINLYVAIYNADNSLKRVEMTRCVKNGENIFVSLTEPHIENGESYKLMLWDISYSPLINAITSSDGFFN